MSDNINVENWIEAHAEDYQAAEARLAQVRDILLNGDISDAGDVLAKAYDNAVFSIRTELDRHERAFTAHYAGKVDRKEAALMTVYGGHKKNWMRRTHSKTNWEALAAAVRCHYNHGRLEELLDTVVDNLVGVSYRKASFMLAMAGLDGFACIDSNVGRYAGIETDNEYYSAATYMEEVDSIMSEIAEDKSPFVTQWAIYDYERGEHAMHMAYFTEVLR